MRGTRWAAAIVLAVVTAVTGPAPAASAGEWHPWYCMTVKVPGTGKGKPGVAARADGLVDVFAASDLGVYHRPWSSSTGWLDRWVLLGEPPGTDLDEYTDVSAVARPGNRISLVIKAGGQAWHRAYQPGGWGAWEPLGRPSANVGSSPAVSARPNGTVDVWVRGDGDGQVYHKYFVGGQGWQGWTSIGGGVSGAPAAAGDPEGDVWVFARGVDGKYYSRVWDSGTRTWFAWQDRAAPPTGSPYSASPGAAARTTGLVDFFVLAGQDGPIYHKWRSATGAWSAYGSLQGDQMYSGPNAATRPGGALDLVVRKLDGTVCHRFWA